MSKPKATRNACILPILLGLLAMVMVPEAAFAESSGEDSGQLTRTDSGTLASLQAEGKLPDTIDPSIPDDATLISKDIAVTRAGEIKDVKTGAEVWDTRSVGSAEVQPDPLAKTNGRRFIPVSVKDVKNHTEQKNVQSVRNAAVKREAVERAHNSNYFQRGAFAGETAGTGAHVLPASLPNSSYGAFWGSSSNGSPAFYQADGQLFAQQAKGVIDVSEWQGDIDWQTAKNHGVEGAIIRIGFGWGNRLDYKAQRNINECKRLGIPFGIYLYSYAQNSYEGAAEGRGTVDMLQRAGVQPGDLSYPVYYDLEFWAIQGVGAAPRSPQVNQGMVNNWFSQLMTSGYQNLAVYSYTSYLYSALNTPDIHAKTTWVASYGSRPGFRFPNNQRCWQYSDAGRIPGIGGLVDLNAMGNLTFVDDLSIVWIMREEDIAVGAAVNSATSNLEYRWQAYDIDKQSWHSITDWTGANWAEWRTGLGNYWLHIEVRNSSTHASIGTRTICFRYVPGYTAMTGTFAGWTKQGVLLGISSNNAGAQYHMKIYDYNAKQWIKDYSGQWATWNPKPGSYWTHYEVYTSDGRLADTRTYAFKV